MDVLDVEVGKPIREHEIERTTQPARETRPVAPAAPTRKPVELPDPSLPVTPERTPVPERVPA